MVRLESVVRDTTTNKLIVTRDRVTVRFRPDATPEVQARVMVYARTLRAAVERQPTLFSARGKFEYSTEEGLSVKLSIGNERHVSVGRVREGTIAEDWAEVVRRMQEHRARNGSASAE